MEVKKNFLSLTRFPHNVLVVIAISLVISPLIFVDNAPKKVSPENSPIKHIVVIMQKNRSFDNYFGTYPGANGIPKDACMPWDPKLPASGCVSPFLSTSDVSRDMPHNYPSSVKAYDGGKMDGFLGAEKHPDTMSYYDDKTIPYYWDLARHHVLADNFFSSALSYSIPNHWYAVAGQAPPESIHYFMHKVPQGNSTSESISSDARVVNPAGNGQGVEDLASDNATNFEYLKDANLTRTVADLFVNSSISWKYYDHPVDPTYKMAVQSGSAYDTWNPFAAKGSSYTDDYYSHFVTRSQIFSDLQTEKFPQVSWVIPSIPLSEHPPASIHKGMIWVADVVNSIMSSKYWNSTAIILIWDDYGGFYDHVAPPKQDQFGLSFRVPALIISPYSKAGYIDHTLYSFESMLKFIEWRFGIPSLTYCDSNANNLLNAFDFSQRPLGRDVVPIDKQELYSISPFINLVMD